MTQSDNNLDSHTRRGWIVSFVFIVLGLIYITSFWGKMAAYLPESLNQWAYLFHSLARPWWIKHVLVAQPDHIRSHYLYDDH